MQGGDCPLHSRVLRRGEYIRGAPSLMTWRIKLTSGRIRRASRICSCVLPSLARSTMHSALHNFAFSSGKPLQHAFTHTTSGVHWLPPLLMVCSLRRNFVDKTSKTHRSVSWSTNDQSKSKTTSCFAGIVLVGYSVGM